MKNPCWLGVALLVIVGCATQKPPERQPLTPEEKDRLRPYWEQFLKQDPHWPESRGKWLQMSEAAQNTLVENMIRYMSNMFNTNRINEARRASAELILLDRLSLEYLVAIMEKDQNAMGLRDMAAGCLVVIGRSAVPGLIRSLDCPRYRARRLATRALARIQDARGIDPLIRVLKGDENFVVRTEAARALGAFQGEDRVGQALCRALGDPELLVVEAAARTLGRLKFPPGVPRLVDRLVEAEKSADSVSLRRTLRRALQKITSLEAASTPDDFRAWHPGDPR